MASLRCEGAGAQSLHFPGLCEKWSFGWKGDSIHQRRYCGPHPIYDACRRIPGRRYSNFSPEGDQPAFQLELDRSARIESALRGGDSWLWKRPADAPARRTEAPGPVENGKDALPTR